MFTSQQGAIALHRCFVEDALLTEYREYCLRVHNGNYSDVEKIQMIQSWEINPNDYSNPSVFASDHQLYSLLKAASFETEVAEDAKRRAYDKFMASEDRCSLVNKRFSSGFKCNQWLADVLSRAKRTISYVMGDVTDFLTYADENADVRTSVPKPPFHWGSLDYIGCGLAYKTSPVRFGPGVSVARPRSHEGRRPPTCGGWEKVLYPTQTSDHIFGRVWEAQGFHGAQVVRGDVMTFAKKNLLEGRTICPGPSLNMRSQLLVGDYLKDRLKATIRVNLRSQVRNQTLARLGSLCDSYATIDLSAASDSIATMLVFELLPFEWFHLLDGIRTKEFYDTINDCWRRYEKFSAMGNGFTFELETLIFYAVAEAAAYFDRGCKALGREEISVYGDDIIVPQDVSSAVMSALQLCGFVINERKSFCSGPFRESCGHDYFNGWLVTPIKIKEFLDDNAAQCWMVYASNLYYQVRSLSSYRCHTPWFRRALAFVYARVRDTLPGVAVFREEYEGDLPSPTYRWLPGWADGYQNLFFCRSLQRMVPRRIAQTCVEVLARYDLPADIAGLAWIPNHRIPEATLERVQFKLRRYKVRSLENTSSA